MLRTAFWLTALILFPVGTALYWLPQQAADFIGASPLWLVRAAGAIITAWSLSLAYGGLRPDRSGAVNLAAGNLLLAATLGAAALRPPLPGLANTLWLAAAVALLLGLAGVAGARSLWAKEPAQVEKGAGA